MRSCAYAPACFCPRNLFLLSDYLGMLALKTSRVYFCHVCTSDMPVLFNLPLHVLHSCTCKCLRTCSGYLLKYAVDISSAGPMRILHSPSGSPLRSLPPTLARLLNKLHSITTHEKVTIVRATHPCNPCNVFCTPKWLPRDLLNREIPH